MIIDSHLHVWDRSKSVYAWLGPHLPEVNRDVTLDEIRPGLGANGVTHVVLVQSADEPGDTDNMLAVAAANRVVAGVVGWVPLEDPAAAERRLGILLQNPLIVGIRNLIHDRPDPDWVLRPAFDAGLSLLEEAGLPFDYVTAAPQALAQLRVVADRHPKLNIVLDHLGKPPIDGSVQALDQWGEDLREVASRPNVYAKISGLYAVHGPAWSWTSGQVADAANIALDAFGPNRIMYGGDWPMSTMAGGYERVLGSMRAATASWSPYLRSKFYAENAMEFYSLSLRP